MTIPEYDEECDCEFCKEEREKRKMTSSSEQPPKEYTFVCDCCQNKCKVTSNNAIPPDCGCLINSDIGAMWNPRPHPAPPQGMTTDELWDYSNDLAEVAARKAREEYTFADAIETFCYIDIYQYFDETRDIEDVSKCKGKECNYCGKFNEESTITTQQSEQEQPR